MKPLLLLIFCIHQHFSSALIEWSKPFFGGGGKISFPFHSHTVSVVSRDLQNVTAAAGQTKALFSMEGSFPSAPLSDHREVGLCTLSDGHRIQWVNKTLKGFHFILLNFSSGMKTSSFSTSLNHKNQPEFAFFPNYVHKAGFCIWWSQCCYPYIFKMVCSKVAEVVRRYCF